MTRERALDRLRKLLRLAAPGSGAADEEARSAAIQAVRLMVEHGLEPVLSTERPAIDLDEVAALAFKAIELEQALARERTAHADQMRQRDQQWKEVVDRVRLEGQAAARKASKTAGRRATLQERESQARAGGRARAAQLCPEEKSGIGRKAADARWARWRAERGLPPR